IVRDHKPIGNQWILALEPNHHAGCIGVVGVLHQFHDRYRFIADQLVAKQRDQSRSGTHFRVPRFCTVSFRYPRFFHVLFAARLLFTLYVRWSRRKARLHESARTRPEEWPSISAWMRDRKRLLQSQTFRSEKRSLGPTPQAGQDGRNS